MFMAYPDPLICIPTLLTCVDVVPDPPPEACNGDGEVHQVQEASYGGQVWKTDQGGLGREMQRWKLSSTSAPQATKY